MCIGGGRGRGQAELASPRHAVELSRWMIAADAVGATSSRSDKAAEGMKAPTSLVPVD